MPYPNTDGKWFNGGYDNQTREIFQTRQIPNVSHSTAALVAEQELPAGSDSHLDDLHQPRPLAQFYGAGNHGTCKTLRQSLGNNYRCTESGRLVVPHSSRVHVQYQHGYRKATFCPCPGGDSPSAKRHYDALHAGCIPIILSHDFVWPFTNEFDTLSTEWPLNVSEFSIRLDANAYEGRKYDNQCKLEQNGTQIGDLQSFLETVSREDIQRLREGALRMSERYAYYKRRSDLPENPLREGVLPDGGAAHSLVQLLSERANGQLWRACQKELERKPASLDKVLSFKC
jgi:hypothetical protein